MRLPQPAWRTPLLLVFLLGLHLLLGARIEQGRVLLLRALVVPWTWFRAGEGDETRPVSPEVAGRYEEARRAEIGDEGTAEEVFEVLDHDRKGGFLVVAAGHEDGARRGEVATVPEGCIGVVDLVTAHLCRVRLLGAAGTKVLVQVPEPARKLPGGIGALIGTIEGGGREVIVSDAFLPESFRKGDPLVTVDGTWPVGVVETEGVRPTVRLAARPEGRSTVRIGSARSRGPRAPLFTDREARVLRCGIGAKKLGLAEMAAPEGVLHGAGVHAGGRLLGQVGVIAGGAILIHPPGSRGPGLQVLVVQSAPDSGAGVAASFSIAGGRARLIGPDGKSVPTGQDLVFSAGGQDLLPGGLLVAQGCDEGCSFEPDPAGEWPTTVQVAVFRFGDELRFLREQRP